MRRTWSACGGLLRRERLLRRVDDGREALRIAHGEVSHHLAIDRDTGQRQTVDQARVRQIVQARGGVDADDPEAAEIPLAGTAVTVGIGQGAHQRFVRPLEEAVIGAVVTLDLRQDLLVPAMGGDAALNSGHGFVILLDSAVSTGPLWPGVDIPRARRERSLQPRPRVAQAPYGSRR